MMIWYTYIFWNDYHNNLSYTCITSHGYFFVYVVRTFKIYTLSNFQIHNTVLLLIITILFIWSPELTCLMTGNLYPFEYLHSFSPQPWQPLVYFVSVSLVVFLDSICKWDDTCIVFLWLIESIFFFIWAVIKFYEFLNVFNIPYR